MHEALMNPDLTLLKNATYVLQVQLSDDDTAAKTTGDIHTIALSGHTISFLSPELRAWRDADCAEGQGRSLYEAPKVPRHIRHPGVLVAAWEMMQQEGGKRLCEEAADVYAFGITMVQVRPEDWRLGRFNAIGDLMLEWLWPSCCGDLDHD
jgi:hypothetical protein